MNGVDGYKLENRNSLSGEYSKNVQPVNNDELIVKNPFKPSNNNNVPRARNNKIT